MVQAAAAGVQFPSGDIVLEEPAVSVQVLARAYGMVQDGTCSHGYLLVSYDNHQDLLLLYNKGIHSAARLVNGEIQSLAVRQFFDAAREGRAKATQLNVTDVGLSLLMAVVMQNDPTLKVPSNLADAEKVMADLQFRGKSAGLVLRRDGERNLAFFRNGHPVATYFCESSARPTTPPREQILQFVNASKGKAVTFEVFHRLDSRCDPDADRPFEELIAGVSGAAPFFLTVKHGGQVVERRVIKTGKAAIGREPTNDIVLDHRSVSRNHCIFSLGGSTLSVADNGSSNGTKVNGQKIDAVDITLGDRVQVGEYEIIYGEEEDEQSTAGELDTIFLAQSAPTGRTPTLIVDGAPVPIDRPVFTLGSGDNANLRVKGFLMKAVQATVIRESQDAYRLMPTEGGRAVKVNGVVADSAGEPLKAGDEITLGKRKLVFLFTAT